MQRRLLAQRLLKQLNEKVTPRLDLETTLILGVVLKGLPVAYGLAKMNRVIENFVPLVALRHVYMQHRVESYFPSRDWLAHFNRLVDSVDCILIADDVVNTGFTRQKVEGIVHSLVERREIAASIRFSGLVLNRRKLANSSFARPNDIFALEVSAVDVECDWGLMTVPLWDLPVEEAIQRIEGYYEQYWLNERRWVTVSS